MDISNGMSASRQRENHRPLISVITVCLNAQDFIEQCIKSVLSQEFDNFEYIIIDGGSSDGTVDIIRRYQDRLAYWHSEPDQGIYHAWNKALKHANGEWVCFLGADDYFWDEKVLVRMAEELAKLPLDIRVAYGQVALVNQRDEVLNYVGEPWCRVKKKFMQIMALPHQGVMHHRSLFKVHGLFDERFQIAGDYELLLRELKVGKAFFISDVTVAGMRLGGVSNDPKQSLLLLREMRMAHRKHLAGCSGWCWWLAYIKVRIRLLLWHWLGEARTRKLLDVARMLVGLPRYWTRS